MVAQIPKGVYTMKAKRAIIKHNAALYRKATKKVKSIMLDELTEMLHMNRQHLAKLLRSTGRVVARKGNVVVVSDLSPKSLSRRGKKRVYGQDVVEALKKIWPLTGYASSKHLVAFIRLNHDILFSHPEFKDLRQDTKDKLLKVSASTVDRLLKPYRDKLKLKLKKRYRANPFSSNLKKSIQVESWFDKPKEPGYVEVDLVHHSGVSGKGEFIYTLTATEVSTGWTELRALRNKAMVWTRKALEDAAGVIPLPLKKLHSDNGSEFINAHVHRFCKGRGIDFTRSRPYRKNDSPYVESKNWSMVRAYTGWRRYDTDEELEALRNLLRLITIRHNLFMPHMRLVSRHREGRKVHKTYDMDIPLNRVLKSPAADADTKQNLTNSRNSTDIVRLSKEIEQASERLSHAYEKKLRRLNDA
jgi:hypothetical protein